MLNHIVAMRFGVGGFPGIKPMEPDFIERCARLLENYALKSLKNMRNKNFRCVFLLNDTEDLRSLGPLVPAAAELDASMMRASAFSEFCAREAKLGKIVISRCDSDDLYANWVVDDIQNEAEKMGMSGFAEVYGYTRFLMHRVGTDTMRLVDKGRFYPFGHWSAFQTVIFGKNGFSGINPYMWSHNDIRGIVKKGFKLPKVVHSANPEFPSVWIRDGGNSSGDTSSDDLKYPVVSVDHDLVEKTFGVRLA